MPRDSDRRWQVGYGPVAAPDGFGVHQKARRCQAEGGLMKALFLHVLLPVSVFALVSGMLAGCTTEGVCFDDCHGVVAGGSGGTGAGNGGNGGTLHIGMGGDDDGPNFGGKVN